MQFNVFHPQQAVAAAFEKPRTLIALTLVVVSALGNPLGALLLGLQLDFVALSFWSIVYAFVRLAYFTVALTVLSLLLKKTIGNIKGVISALSLTFLVNLGATAIFSVLQLVLVPHELIAAMVSGVQSGTSAGNIVMGIQDMPGMGGIGVFLGLVGLLFIAVVVLNFLILFHALRWHLGKGRIVTIILTLLVAIVTIYLPIA